MLTGEKDRRRAIGGARPRLLGSNRDGARFLQSGLLGGAAVALVMAAPVPAAEVSAPCPTAAPVARSAAGEESWLQRQIVRFRGYPHLDRAYRLMKQGKAQDATDELASYLRRDPYDVAARKIYLTWLSDRGRYARTACKPPWWLKMRWWWRN